MDPIERIRTERERLTQRLDELVFQYNSVSVKLEHTRQELQELEMALNVVERYSGDEPQQADQELRPLDVENDSPQITAKDAVWAILSESGGKGLRSSIIKKRAENRFGIKIESKTCGNILWRLKEQKKAHREGHLWYPAEQTPEDRPSLLGPTLISLASGLVRRDEMPEKTEGPDE